MQIIRTFAKQEHAAMKRTALLFFAAALLLAGCNRSERQYRAIVETLDVSKPLELENITKARDMITDASGLTSDQTAHLQELFIGYLTACADVQTSLMEEAYGAALNTPDADEAVRRIDSLTTTMDSMCNYGLLMYASEGGIETEIMPLYVAHAFWRYLTPSERDLAELSEMEMENPSLNDAAIAVEFDEIAHRLKRCDDMLAAYPDDQLTAQMTACQKYYLAILLAGSDNSPVFDWATGRLQPEIQQTAEAYIETYPDAASTPILREFIDIAAQNDFKDSPALQRFVSEKILN